MPSLVADNQCDHDMQMQYYSLMRSLSLLRMKMQSIRLH